MNEQMNGMKEGVEIDLQKLLLAYLRKWWLIVIVTLVAALGTYYYTANHITPMYRTSVMIYVNNTKSEEVIENLTTSNISAAKHLVNTYVNIITSDTVLEKVVEQEGLPYSAEQIRGMMAAEQVDETEIFRVHVTHADPQTAADVANAIADVAPGEIGEIVEGSSTKIIDYAKVPTARFSPSYSKNTTIGAVVGLAIALVYVTLRHLLDVRIKNSEDLEALFSLPILGTIPVFIGTDVRKNERGSDTKAEEEGT